MTESGSNDNMLTYMRSFGDQDIEAGSNNEHASDIERKVRPNGSTSDEMAHGENNDRYDSDIDKWAGSLARVLEDVPPYMCNPGHPGRVGRIPGNLREVDVKAYEPHFLSIGPYHHGKQRLQQMETRKRIVLKCFLAQKHEHVLAYYLNEIKSIEPLARSFYSDVDMDSENFVEMLLLDSFYIVTIFYGMAKSQEWMNQTNIRIMSELKSEDITDMENRTIIEKADELNYETRSEEDNVDEPGWFWPLFVHDLFLLENQLPFFVLQKMFALAYGGSEAQLIEISKVMVGNMLSSYVNIDSETAILPSDEFHHLLHLCHLFFRPALEQEYTTSQLPESSEMFRLESALQLYEAGVRFEARSGSTQYSLVDITFSSSGEMVIPVLHVDDNTDSLLRNLIALEQMKFPSLGLDISAYVVLLLHLVTIPEDVRLLRKKGIIMHHLASDKEMMYLVNRLSVGLSFDYVEDRYSLKPVLHELRRYTKRKVPRWRSWLKHRYFNNPWTVISLLAASLLLLLAAIQTYYTVYSYYQPCLHCLDGHS